MIQVPRRDKAILVPAIGAQLIATTSMYIAPVLLDALQRGGLSGGTAGILFSFELVVSALTTLLVPTVCPPHSARRGALLGGALAILGAVLTMISPAFAALLVARLIAGAGAGIVAAEATMVVARGIDRERLIAALTIVAILNAAFWLVVLPYAADRFGYRGPYGGLLLISLAGAFLLTRLPSPTMRRPEKGMGGRQAQRGPWRGSWVLVAGAIFLTQLGQGAFWSLEETFGAAAGLSGHVIGLLLSLVTLFLLVGAMGAAWAGASLGRFAPLLALTLANAVAVLAVVMIATPAVFVAANLAQSVTNLSSVIYQLGLAASLDRSGRVVSAGMGLVTLGNGIGPSLSASLHDAFGIAGVGLLLFILYGLALALYGLVGLSAPSGGETRMPSVASVGN
jgi:predicted MFS family arabinose efflux permease